MMKKTVIMVVVFLGIVSINSTFLFAGTFVKHGNNGTKSCSEYCAGSRWSGGIGSCVSAFNTKTKRQESCDSVPGFLNGPELTCTCESGKLPIRASLDNTVGSHWYMETNVTLSINGRIDGVTKTKSCQRKGFTGGVWIALLDQSTNVLHITNVRSYGVNGKGFDNRCQQRRAPWNESISPDLAKKVGGIVIYHTHNPKDRITKEDVYEAIEKGAKIYTATQAK